MQRTLKSKTWKATALRLLNSAESSNVNTAHRDNSRDACVSSEQWTTVTRHKRNNTPKSHPKGTQESRVLNAKHQQNQTKWKRTQADLSNNTVKRQYQHDKTTVVIEDSMISRINGRQLGKQLSHRIVLVWRDDYTNFRVVFCYNIGTFSWEVWSILWTGVKHTVIPPPPPHNTMSTLFSRSLDEQTWLPSF